MRRALSAVLILAASAALAGDRPAVDRPARYVLRAAAQGATVVVSYRLPATHPHPRFVALAVAISADPGTTVKLHRGSFTLVTPERRLVPLMSREQFQEVEGELRPYLAKGEAVRDPLGYVPTGRKDCRLALLEPARGRLARDEVTVTGGVTCSGWLVFEVPGGAAPGTYTLAVEGEGIAAKLPLEIPSG